MKTPFICAVLALSFWQFTPAPPTDGYSGVEGVVVRSDVLRSVANVRVTLSGPSSDAVFTFQNRTVSTDTDGRFGFTDVPPGRYVLRAASPGFFGDGIAGTPVTLLPSQRRTGITLVLDPGATIQGRVTDSHGKAIPNVRVVYLQPTLDGLMPAPNPISPGFAETNSDGEYELSGVRFGEYYIRAEFADERSEEAYRSTYYPDALEVAKGRPVFVPAGATITGINIEVQRTVRVTVSGRVDRLVGNSTEGLRVRLILYPRDPIVPSEMTSSTAATIDALTGEFQIRNVIPGAYTLYAEQIESEGYRGQTLVEVPDTGLKGVSVVLRPPVDLVGRVIGLPSAVSTPPGSIRRDSFIVRLRATTPSYSLGNGEINKEGQFVFKNAHQDISYFFMPDPVVPLPADFYIQEMRQGGRSILNTGVVIASTSPEPIEVTVAPRGGSINGIVRNRMLASSSAYIFLIPAGPRRENRALHKSTQSDETGRFAISGITPGTYQLFAWEAMPTTPLLGVLDLRFLLRYEDRGTSITVREGQQIENATVNLIPRGQ